MNLVMCKGRYIRSKQGRNKYAHRAPTSRTDAREEHPVCFRGSTYTAILIVQCITGFSYVRENYLSDTLTVQVGENSSETHAGSMNSSGHSGRSMIRLKESFQMLASAFLMRKSWNAFVVRLRLSKAWG